MMVSRPSANVVLNVMKQGIHAIQFALDCTTVVLVFGSVNIFGDFQQLIGFSICLAKAVVVGVVVVEVEQKLVGERFKASGKIIDMGEAAEFTMAGLATMC